MTGSQRARRLPSGVEVALAAGAGTVSFTVAAVILAVAGSVVVGVVLGLASVAGVVALMRAGAVLHAIPAAMAVLVAYDWFLFPPTHRHGFPDATSLLNLLAYLGGAVLIGALAADSGRRADVTERARSELADEQAALRRVATLVASHVPPADVFTAVAREVGQLLGVDHTHMGRYEDDGTVTGVGSWSPSGDHVPDGTRAKVEGGNVTALVARTGRPARLDRYGEDAGPVAAALIATGVRSSVGVPIMLEGDLWGVLIASNKQEQPLPEDTESRIAAFTQLAAMALSNTEAWAEVHALADEQAALRRVATLVAGGASQADVFDAVASEASRLLGSAATALMRYDPDDAATVVSTGGGLSSFELRVPAHAQLIAAKVLRTGRAARVERDDVDPADDLARILGLGAGVGAPIVSDGRLWGLVMALTQDDQPPASTESRLAQFAELVATAIGNSESRAELTASRARIVAATDEERRRVVRDLHDGAQQRLVHTIVTLKLASRALQRGEDPSSFVSEALEQAKRANVELRELSHGILPAVLTRGGLPAAVDALASRMPVPVEIAVSPERLPAAVEATAYFVIAEALTNVAKHARAGRATVATEVEDGLLHIDIHDDGIGGARPDGGGLVGLADRVAVLHGRLNVESPPWGGTLVTADIPVSGSSNAGIDPAIASGD